MEEAQLRERLEELHCELESGPELHEETRELLQTIVDDARRMLTRAERAEPAEHHSLAERLREVSWNAEQSHPRLTTAVSQLIDALTKPFQ